MRFQNYMQTDPATGEKTYGAVPLGDPLPEDAWPVEGQPTNEFESHCPRAGKIVCDLAGKADFEAGKDHIQAAHLMKAIEARLILAGYDFDGIIKAEAQATNQDVHLLAEQIASKSQALVDTEMRRRIIKTEAKSG